MPDCAATRFSERLNSFRGMDRETDGRTNKQTDERVEWKIWAGKTCFTRSLRKRKLGLLAKRQMKQTTAIHPSHTRQQIVQKLVTRRTCICIWEACTTIAVATTDVAGAGDVVVAAAVAIAIAIVVA